MVHAGDGSGRPVEGYARLRGELVARLSAHGSEAVERTATAWGGTARLLAGAAAQTVLSGLKAPADASLGAELDAAALRWLSRLDPGATSVAAALLACRVAPLAVRRAAASVLAASPEGPSLEALLAVLAPATVSEDDEAMLACAADALCVLARGDVGPRLLALWTEELEASSRTPRAHGPIPASQPAYGARAVLLSIMHVLGVRRVAPAVAHLGRTARSHPDAEVAVAAQRALVALGGAAALDALADSVTGAGEPAFAVYGALARDYELGFAFLAHCLDPDRLSRDTLPPGDAESDAPLSHRRAARVLHALADDAEHVLATPPREATRSGAPVCGWLEDPRWADVAEALVEAGIARDAAERLLAARHGLVKSTSGIRRVRAVPDVRDETA